MSEITDSKTIGQRAGEILNHVHPDWSIDTLLVHPKEACELCILVRRSLGKRIDDEEILQSLLNARKRGLLKKASDTGYHRPGKKIRC